MSGGNNKSGLGWLFGLLNLPPVPSDEEQAHWAGVRRSEIMNRSYPTGVLSALLDQRKADLLKLEFALSRDIQLSKSDWLLAVVYCAAAEHPELNVRRRGKGRPKRIRPTGLLSGYFPDDQEADDLIPMIEEFQIKFCDRHPGQKKPSVKKILEFTLENDGRGKVGERLFDNEVRKLENRISRARMARKRHNKI